MGQLKGVNCVVLGHEVGRGRKRRDLSGLQSITFPHDYLAQPSIFGQGQFSLLSPLLWNAIRILLHAKEQLFSLSSIWMQHWILRRKWFHCGLKSSTLSPPTYTIYISWILNWITVKRFITEAQPGGHALGSLCTDKCIIHKLDLIIQNLQANHIPWGNSFHKLKWLYLQRMVCKKRKKSMWAGRGWSYYCPFAVRKPTEEPIGGGSPPLASSKTLFPSL